MSPYVYERQTEYWTSRGIEDYFLDGGYEVLAFPLTQLTEKNLPVDFVFFEEGTSKLFGLQYKALYANVPDYWPIDSQQHTTLQSFSDWAYYCLSELKTARDHRLALHQARFIPVTSVAPGHLPISTRPYMRWGGFANALQQCTVGRRIESSEDLRQALLPLMKQVPEVASLIDVFVAELNQRRLLHLYPIPPPHLAGRGQD